MGSNELKKVEYSSFKFVEDLFDLGVIKCAYTDKETLEFINKSLLNLLGYSWSEYAARFATEHLGFIVAEDRIRLQKRLQQLFADKITTACFKVRALDANDKMMLLSMTAILLDTDGVRSVVYVVSLCSTSCDLIDRYYGDIFGKNIVGNIVVCNFTEQMEILYVSTGFLNAMGSTERDLLGAAYIDLVVSESGENVFVTICQECVGGKHCRQERQLKIGANRVCFMEQCGIIHLDSGQKLIKMVLTDISRLKQTEESLRVSEKSYELALEFSDVALFGYDLESGVMSVHRLDNDIYGIPAFINNAPQYLVDKGVIAPRSVDDFLEMYEKIHAGAPIADAQIWAVDTYGKERMLDIRLANIFDRDGVPIRAIGMHKDITESVLLKREQEYNKGLSSDLLFIYEANISNNEMLNCNAEWLEQNGLCAKEHFSEFVQQMCEHIVDVEQQDVFMAQLSVDILIDEYAQGNKLLNLEFASTHDGTKLWYSQSINIIYNDVSNDYLIRCYLTDITQNKSKAQRAISEQMFYESMLSEAVAIYEVNITNNRIVNRDKVDSYFALRFGNNYNNTVNKLAEQLVHPEDRDGFVHTFERQNILAEFNLGNNIHVYDYRALNEQGKWEWLRSTIHLFGDSELGDVFGFSYIEKVDEEKRKEIELLYKSQHDLLTGFYNKLTFKEKVDEYLLSAEGRYGKHTFFIVDLDNFKNINDNFGHAFGDAVISEAAAKIMSIFREEDILGRIGGDEFGILMKNVGQKNMVYSKAKKLCDLVYENYSKKGVKYHVSASVGVAYYNTHGSSYEELYHNSDIAMYNSKEYGRNRFSVYEDSMRICDIESVPEETSLSKGRKFEDYVCEYVLRILYDSQELDTAVNSVLELLGKHYGFCRVYIFEDYDDNKYTTNTFEWCQKSVEPQMFRLQNLSYEEMGDLSNKFNAEGVLLVNDIQQESASVQATMREYGIESMLAVRLKKDGQSIGFIGFDNCCGRILLEPEQIGDLINIANTLGMFIVQMRTRSRIDWANNMALSVLNNLNSYVCVCNPDTYEMLFVNKYMQDFIKDANVGDVCYKVLWDIDTPCTPCMTRELKSSGKERISKTSYNGKFNMWVRTDVSWIELVGYGRALLINNTDISEYKK